jgi:thiol-disulfide isomerase/thioredoxin
MRRGDKICETELPGLFARAWRGEALGVAALLVWCALPLLASGRTAPELKLKDLRGQAQRLSALRGQIVVVNFWATWCGPCQEELPRLSKLAADWAGKDVRIVAVSIDARKDQGKIGPELERLHVAPTADFAVWVGSNSDTLADFGLGEIVPGTVVIGRDGKIVTRIMGEAKDDDVRTAVNWLLKDGVGNPPPALVKRF